MAKLENLRGFDTELRMAAVTDIKNFQASVGTAAVWSDSQQVQLSKLVGSLGHLINAVSEAIGKNR